MQSHKLYSEKNYIVISIYLYMFTFTTGVVDRSDNFLLISQIFFAEMLGGFFHLTLFVFLLLQCAIMLYVRSSSTRTHTGR
jgi:hypothetical protein